MAALHQPNKGPNVFLINSIRLITIGVLHPVGDPAIRAPALDVAASTPEPVDGDTDEQRGKAGCAASGQAPRVGLRLAEAYCRVGYFRVQRGGLRPTDFLGDVVNFVYDKATLKFLEYLGIWIVRVPTQMKEIQKSDDNCPPLDVSGGVVG